MYLLVLIDTRGIEAFLLTSGNERFAWPVTRSVQNVSCFQSHAAVECYLVDEAAQNTSPQSLRLKRYPDPV